MSDTPFTSDHARRLDNIHRALMEKSHAGEESVLVRLSRLLDVMESDANGAPLFQRLREIQRAIDAGSIVAKWMLWAIVTTASVGSAILVISSWGAPK